MPSQGNTRRPSVILLASALAMAVVAADRARADDPGASAPPTTACGAGDLRLAPDLSFSDDSSAAFPILARGADAGTPSDRVPTIVFFGTSHCYNTNREAERFVALYAKRRADACFVVVDLDAVSEAQKPLVERLYRGAIPTIAVLAADGRTVYGAAGETARARGDTTALERLLDRARAPAP